LIAIIASSSEINFVKQFHRIIAQLGLLAILLAACMPAFDLPDTSFDESDTSITIGIAQVSVPYEPVPVPASISQPLHNVVQPIEEPEHTSFVHPTARLAAGVSLALLGSFLC
jgi:hypothetical protein